MFYVVFDHEGRPVLDEHGHEVQPETEGEAWAYAGPGGRVIDIERGIDLEPPASPLSESIFPARVAG